MNLQAALQKIYSMHQFTIKLGLERVLGLLEDIGNPHLGIKYFHIAGSNGKGSTAAFIASMLIEAGYKVGLYTSPHFVRFNERIKINGEEIDDEYIAKFVSSVDKYIDEHEPTFFEITTALAFKYFAEKKPDYVVLETGLGGRLDATNVVQPLASVITSIGLEHTNILGETIELIAVEKTGIIKPDSILVSGLISEEAFQVINKKSEETKCQHFPLKDVITTNDDSISLFIDSKKFYLYKTGLQGFHQLVNGALAVYTVNRVLGLTSAKIFNAGLTNVVKNTGIEGRYEVINNQPKIIFDSAHNPDGIKTFVGEFSKEYANYTERTLIIGAMKDKDIAQMFKIITPYFDKIYTSRVNYDRAATIDEIVSVGKAIGLKVTPLADPLGFIQEFRSAEEAKCLVVLGSMYLLGEIKSGLTQQIT